MRTNKLFKTIISCIMISSCILNLGWYNTDVFSQEAMLTKEYVIFDNYTRDKVQVKRMTNVEKNKVKNQSQFIVEENITLKGSSIDAQHNKKIEKIYGIKK